MLKRKTLIKFDPSYGTRGIAEERKNDPKRNKMILKYSTRDESNFILEGINEHKDFIYVLLDRVDKKYALSLGIYRPGRMKHE
ncbi:MAG: hypothetical protein ICV66_02970 [Chitinophagaceae bacterium]|nr:hypothetical protein [Chitinophagaceae bacterium]